jgi:hypothetical protein
MIPNFSEDFNIIYFKIYHILILVYENNALLLHYEDKVHLLLKYIESNIK